MGDIAGTIGHTKIWNYIHWKAGWGIKRFQGLVCGYPKPAADLTHVVGFIGELEDVFVEALLMSGLLFEMARDREKPEQYIADELKEREDICFEVTDPFAQYCFWADVSKKDWMLASPDFCDFSQQWQRAAWVSASANTVGRRYDRKQLFGILLEKVAGIPDAKYKRWIDRSPFTTVCSGGQGAAFESVRKAGKVQLGYSRPEPPAEEDPWQRLFGGMHLEKIPPAVFFALPRRATWKMEFSLKATARCF